MVNKIITLITFLGLTLALSACGMSSVSGEAARMITGQVADYDGPAGVLEATTGVVSLPEAGTGSIEADGTFKFELNESPTGFFPSPVVPPGCSEVSVSGDRAKVLNVVQLSVVSDGRIAGTLSQSRDDSESNKSLPLPDVLVSRAYVDRDVTAKGTCSFSFLETKIISTYNVSYKQGWNTILTETTFSADGLTANSKITSATASDIKTTEWSY